MDGSEGAEGEERVNPLRSEKTLWKYRVIEQLHETFPNKVNLAFKCYLLAQHGLQHPVSVIVFLNQSPSLFEHMKTLISLILLHVKKFENKFVLRMTWYVRKLQSLKQCGIKVGSQLNRSVKQESL